MTMQRSYRHDIADLERMLDDGEGDAALSEKAIGIFRDLEEARKIWGFFGHISAEQLLREVQYFESVLHKIRTRRHDGVLRDYDAYVEAVRNP